MLNETLKSVGRAAGRSGSYTLVSLMLLGPALQAYAEPLLLATSPIFIKKGVAPNIFVTFDDSGSMAQAYTPDVRDDVERACYSYNWRGACTSGNVWAYRRYASPDWNLQYYNPDLTYVPPKKADGSSFSTSFSKAFINGFKPDVNSNGTDDTVDLSSEYKLQRYYDPADGRGQDYTGLFDSSDILRHPKVDFGSSGKVNANSVSSGQKAYYYRYNDECATPDRTGDECYDYVEVGTEPDKDPEVSKQNFANWYSFYRTRVFSAASAATLAFEAVNESSRIAFQALNTCTTFGQACPTWTGSKVSNWLRPFSKPHKEGFYKWLSLAPAAGGTPLRSALIRAGDEITKTGKDGAYAFDPGTVAEPVHECRASYHMVFTDGVWKGDSYLDTAANDYENYDNTSHTGPVTNPPGEFGTQDYSPKPPFKDDYKTTLADIAFSQWFNDAQPNVDDKVPTFIIDKTGSPTDVFWNPRNDPAHWQHMTTFTVGLGFSDVMDDPDFTGDTFGGDFAALAKGTKSWPMATSNGEDNAYDLWHAAINGRGKFFSADDPTSLVEAFRKALQGIQDRTATAAAPAANSALVQGADFAYAASFNSENWSGDLRAFPLTEKDGTLSTTNIPKWSAANQLATASVDNRKILVANGSNVLVDFKYSNLSAAQQAMLSQSAIDVPDDLGEERVEWLRGSDADEGTLFRARGAGSSRRVLGDIIYSAPLYVGAPSYLNLDKTEGFARTDPESYEAFKKAQVDRKPMVYVGANDGMLHAFDAATGDEVFAFVPSAVVPDLYKLTSTGYIHQPFVDGELNSFDVYDPNSTTRWRTMLVGTLRGGGKSVFALDVTNPESPKLMWERGGANDPFEGVRDHLGYTYSKAQIGRLHNSKWGVIVGNGYNSSSGQSALLVLEALTGDLIKVFATGEGAAGDTNGLAEPVLADYNGDLIVDSVYGGDLHGHLWRFDLVNTVVARNVAIAGNSTQAPRENGKTISQWKIAEAGPLFTAVDPEGARQSITSKPQLALHPFGDSYLVAFGTGKYLELDDSEPNTTRVDSFYSVWDRSALDSTIVNGDFTRANLQQLKLLRYEEQEYDLKVGEEIQKVANTIKRITTETVEWLTYSDDEPYISVNERGWYLDFVEYKDDGTGKATSADPVNVGEMVVTNPIVRGTGSDPILFFMTSTPLSSPCESGLENYIYGLSAAGGPPKKRQFDLNNDGLVNGGDYNSADAKYAGGVNNVGAVKIANTGGFNLVGENVIGSTANGVEINKTSFGASDGRQTWRQLR